MKSTINEYKELQEVDTMGGDFTITGTYKLLAYTMIDTERWVICEDDNDLYVVRYHDWLKAEKRFLKFTK